MELFDTVSDPMQFENLAKSKAHQALVDRMRAKVTAKLAEVRDNDL